MSVLDHAYNCMIPEMSYFVRSNDRIFLLIVIVERCIVERYSTCIVSIPPPGRARGAIGDILHDRVCPVLSCACFDVGEIERAISTARR